MNHSQKNTDLPALSAPSPASPHGKFSTTSTSSGGSASAGDATRSRRLPRRPRTDAPAVSAAPARRVPDAGLPGGVPPPAAPSRGAVPGTKTLANLFLELAHGDCALHAPADSAPPAPAPRVVRAVHVATVRIRNRRGALLVETRQLLSDGTVRRRGPRPLSEKMRPGESPESAAARAVREELGARARVRILGGDGAARVEERESASYPGLPARYVLHAVDAEVVDGVPEEGEFETEEAGEDDGDADAITVKRHYWEWVDDEEDGDSDRREVAAAGARAH